MSILGIWSGLLLWRDGVGYPCHRLLGRGGFLCLVGGGGGVSDEVSDEVSEVSE